MNARAKMRRRPGRIAAITLLGLGGAFGLSLIACIAILLPDLPRAMSIARMNGDAAKGKVLFLGHCAVCHQRMVNVTVPPSGFSKSVAIAFVIDGVRGTKMPAFSDFSNQQVSDLYAYLQTLPRTRRER
jgi:mono/diheme cytochrome c family protein